MPIYIPPAIKVPLYQDPFPLPVDRYLSFLPPPPLHPRVGTYIPRPTCRASLRRVHQTNLKDLVSLLSGGLSRKTANRYVCCQRRVHSVCRIGGHNFTHPPVMAFGLVECGDMHVHDLDGSWLLHSVRELYPMERECHQLGTGVVRYQYVRTSPHSILVSDEPYPATRIQVGLNVAWSACALCIMRRLYFIATTTTVTTTQNDVSCRIGLSIAKHRSNTESTLTETS
jgi:hypothetical protein